LLPQWGDAARPKALVDHDAPFAADQFLVDPLERTVLGPIPPTREADGLVPEVPERWAGIDVVFQRWEETPNQPKEEPAAPSFFAGWEDCALLGTLWVGALSVEVLRRTSAGRGR
jgi:hypothetical protein